MRVLMINTTYGQGGPPLVISNLQHGFERRGIQTEILVGDNNARDGAIIHSTPSRGRWVERGLNALAYRIGLSNNGLTGTFRLSRENYFQKADVLSLHNLHGGYFNFLALPRLTHNKPGVLTLHDMWPFTGHCVYSFDCERWSIGCGSCPYPEAYQGMQRDASRLEHRLKRWSFSHSNIHIVAISRWIERCARASYLASHPIYYIPNGIDLEAYRPLPQTQCRQALNLPLDRKIILYVAHRLSDQRKGFDLLAKALEQLPDTLRQQSLLLILGEAEESLLRQLTLDHVSLGYVSEPERKAWAYNAADVFAFPTRADNLPVVLQESMACGTPMVSFSVGGVPDLVRHGETGLLAPPEDVDCFKRQLVKLLDDDALRKCLSLRCREIAKTEYSIDLQVERYFKIFTEITNKSV